MLNSVIVISAMKTEKGLALQDMLTGAYEYVETIDFKPQARVYLLDFLATTEYVTPESRPMARSSLNVIDIDSPLGRMRKYN